MERRAGLQDKVACCTQFQEKKKRGFLYFFGGGVGGYLDVLMAEAPV